MGTSPSWKGEHRLKTQVLAQLRAHHQAASLAPIQISGQQLHLCAGVDPLALEEALGIPAALWAIGLWLWQGYPEDLLGIQEHIEEVRAFVAAIPVGHDLAPVVPTFLARWASEPGWGLVGCSDGRYDTLFEELALGLLGEPFAVSRLIDAKRQVQDGMAQKWADHLERRTGARGPDGRATFIARSGGIGEQRVMACLDAGVAMAIWEREPAGLRRALDMGLLPDAEQAARSALLASLGSTHRQD